MIGRAFASILLVAGFLFSPVYLGIGPKADIAPTSSAVEVLFRHGPKSGVGSGVYIGNDMVVTARHVVRDSDNGSIIVLDQVGEQVSATVQWTSSTTDVAVLKISAPLHVAIATLDKRAPTENEPVEVVGCPFGRPFVHTKGVAIGPAQDLVPGLWQDAIPINAEIHPGNSGGPAYDRDGKVLGIVVGMITDQNQQPIAGIMISAREVAE